MLDTTCVQRAVPVYNICVHRTVRYIQCAMYSAQWRCTMCSVYSAQWGRRGAFKRVTLECVGQLGVQWANSGDRVPRELQL